MENQITIICVEKGEWLYSSPTEFSSRAPGHGFLGASRAAADVRIALLKTMALDE